MEEFVLKSLKLDTNNYYVVGNTITKIRNRLLQYFYDCLTLIISTQRSDSLFGGLVFELLPE